MSPIATGKDFNYYNNIAVNNASFPVSPQVQISFRGSQILRFDLVSGASVEYSFNGSTVHGTMTASTNTTSLNFNIRNDKFIWFRAASSATVRVEAYGATGEESQSQKATTPLSFATPALLQAFDATSASPFTRVGCGVVNDEYQFITAPGAALLASVDGINVIAASAPVGAVWTRTFVRNFSAQYETAWYLDATTGNDQNDGISSLTPLKTMRELSNRLRGAYIAQNVVINLAAGNYGERPVLFDVEIAQGFYISMVGTTTTTSDTVAVILPTVSGTAATNASAQRGTLTATSYNFQTANDRQRLRITAGTAANIGGIGYITKVVTPGVGGVVNTTRWGRLSNPLTSTTVSNLTIAVNDTYVVETLDSQIGYLDVRVRGNGKFVIQNCLIRSTLTSTVTHRAFCDNGNINGFMTYGCIFQSSGTTLFQGGQWTMALCSISADTGVIAYSGVSFLAARMCVHTGTAATPAFEVRVQNGTTLQNSEGGCFDGGKLVIYTNGVFDQIGQTNNDVQFVDGSGTNAINVATAGTYWAHSATNLVWGLNNTYSSFAVLIEQAGLFAYNAKPSIPGGTSDYSVGGVTGAWASLPIIVTTAAAGTSASAGAGSMMVS
jgi:hypothetical protein